MSFIGMNAGALTVKVVALRQDVVTAATAAHQGRPREKLGELLAAPRFADVQYFGVSGALGHITEDSAIQRALRETAGESDGIASLGGESFLVYALEKGRIVDVHVQQVLECAASRTARQAASFDAASV
jgi:hypothetical protein